MALTNAISQTINGVQVTNTPSGSGQVLTSTSTTAATFQTPSSSSAWYAPIADDCGSASQFLATGNTQTDGTNGVTPIYDATNYHAIVIDTSATAGGMSGVQINPKGFYYVSWNNGLSWNQYWEVADLSSSANGDLFFGTMNLSLFFGTSVNFVSSHIGFRRSWVSGTCTTYATCADGTAETKVSFTPSNNNTSCNFYSIQKTGSTVKFFDCISGTLVATITTNIPTQSPSSMAVFAGSNENNASRIKGVVYNFAMSRQATF